MTGHPPQTPSTLQTPGFAHYGLAWSPFYANRLAVASAANFGLVGNGRLHILNLAPQAGSALPAVSLDKQFPTQDGLYDVAWSEMHENQLVTASGDGSLRLWDITLKVRAASQLNFLCSPRPISRTFPSKYGKNIPAKSSLSTGRISRRTCSVHRPGMELSSW